MGQFEGRVGVVTGAGSGLGNAVARQLASEGASVGLFDIAEDAVEKAAAEIGEQGGTARAYRVDVSDPDSVKTAMDGVARDLGRPSLVVNCAGIGKFAHTHELSYAEWRKIMGVNLDGTFLVCNAALPHLLDGGGSIVNIASNAGVKAQPYSAAYATSKAGVVHLTRCIADEYMKRGIRANCVAPGGMETPLQNSFMEFPDGVDWKSMRKIMSPLGNSAPEEIANVVTFILSDACRYMTGSVVSIDGGITV
jgi:NAD(P)-dependent dehydrogenase (short-subunit alcohol dehydrogenase family)